MPLHDTSYQHWEGVHLGIWQRRLAIARNGLAACWQNKWLRHLIVLCWCAALALVAVLFMVGQLLVADSLIVHWVANFNPDLQAFAAMLTTWLAKHPEISVRTTQDVLFYYFGIYLMPLSLFALGMALPLLITRDLASSAIIIYSSKAVSRGDYWFGKFATAFALLVLTWLGPVCAAWFVGNLLAPDWRFFWHSRIALFHVLVYGLSSMTILSLLALGVSSVSAKEKSTVAFWFMWWVLGRFVGPVALQTKPWLQHLGFSYNLNQVALSIFRLGDDIKIARENIPILGTLLGRISPAAMARIEAPATYGALLALLVMLGFAVLVILKRVKPE
jgi:ABC-2 type transport system permease protein